MNILRVALVLLSVGAVVYGQSTFTTENRKWREKRNTELKAEDGWLTVAGLHWLKEGVTRIGTDRNQVDVLLPLKSGPGKVGTLELKNAVVTLKVEDGVEVVVDKKPVREFEMKFEEGAKPPLPFMIGSLHLQVIKRSDRYALRVRNKNSPARLEFRGLRWYPPQKSYRVVANFTPYDQPKEMIFDNVLGSQVKMKSPGTLSFELQGQKFELRPVIEDEKKLFIVFRDLTTGKTTYGAGRFLYAELPKDGKVVLDFNRAENPPCAFTKFATCPLPPRQNHIKLAIRSGELNYKH
jgi:uncharacterized protein